jgi:hypothetical protein
MTRPPGCIAKPTLLPQAAFLLGMQATIMNTTRMRTDEQVRGCWAVRYAYASVELAPVQHSRLIRYTFYILMQGIQRCQRQGYLQEQPMPECTQATLQSAVCVRRWVIERKWSQHDAMPS